MMNYRIIKQPSYLHQLIKYPENNPLLIAVDHKSFNYIRRLRGFCLLCDNVNTIYEMSCCFNREVWVLYSSQHYFQQALRLGRTAQLSGATKTFVILIQANSRWEVKYVRE